MLEIKGKVNTAICYAKVIEEDAIEQIRTMCDYELTKDSKIRIMPDVHAGAGCTIGTTMTVIDKACPNVVGVDIGCGMYTVKLKEKELDFEKIDEVCHYIPSGKNVWEGREERFDLEQLRCRRNLNNTKRLERSLGTLGGGNHFIEIDKDENDNKYLVIHSGSRNLGLQVANYYQNVGYESLNYISDEYEIKAKELIESYKSSGKKKRIEKDLKKLKESFRVKSKVPKDLCYVEGKDLEDYLHDMDIVQKYATKNREIMARRIVEFMGLDYDKLNKFESIHNYIEVEKGFLRKGAISAYEGEDLLIPINMRDGVIIGKGKGNPNWNFSAPHGAGRILSRAEAKNKIHMNDYKETMKDIFTTCVNVKTLDEAPQAYKPIEEIINNIYDTVEITKIIKPIYNFKSN